VCTFTLSLISLLASRVMQFFLKKKINEQTSKYKEDIFCYFSILCLAAAKIIRKYDENIVAVLLKS